ncbi:DUF2103 domain-containing protein [Synechococcus sp. PCC 7336]|uniref:DUF2103 domain-containing protein n=1 Tax=Synechococcus sp. PCC 7336 TaxID=195250 RepID=UPI0004760802|nr:DUF2103 domain-containing protein [Synechococcus sp. PCC 7336]
MPANKPKGRLVLNHSTHVEGLIPVLEELATYAGIQTITPGALAKVRSRPSNLRLRISVPIRGGFKLQARKGTTVQEVFVITNLDRPEFEQAFQTALAKRG